MCLRTKNLGCQNLALVQQCQSKSYSVFALSANNIISFAPQHFICPNTVTVVQPSICLHSKKKKKKINPWLLGSFNRMLCQSTKRWPPIALAKAMCDVFSVFKNPWAPLASLPPVLGCHLQGLLSDCSWGSWGLGGILISFSLTSVAVKIKKPIKTKFRMPVFNWVALKPNQINGTVFNEIDDERILEVTFSLSRKKGSSLVCQDGMNAVLPRGFSHKSPGILIALR